MRDPHVQSLRYALRHREDVTFHNPPAVQIAESAFEAILDNGILTVTMREHTSREDAARFLVEPTLRAWELHDKLLGSQTGIRFHYQGAEVIDRDPPPPGATIDATMTASLGLSSTLTATLTTGMHAYPPPPIDFAIDATVEAMWHRYVAYTKGREPLLSMAYFCYTILTAAAGGTKEAAALYRVNRDVLKKLSELSSTRGSAATARKAHRTNSPLSHSEEEWVQATVRALIARAAEAAGGRLVSELTMTNLPALET